MNLDEKVKKAGGWARYYRSLGWSVFPVKRGDKTPLIKWEKYQKEIATDTEMREWSKFSKPNVGIATGKVSGIVVVDVEKGGATKDLPPTVCAQTGGGGYHFFYKHPNVLVKNRVRIREKTDVRGDGGYVVAAPSLHKSGGRYQWLISPEDSALAECPQWVLEQCAEDSTTKTDWGAFFAQENLEGNRHQQAVSLTGKILYHMPIEMWDAVGLATLKNWNVEKNKPPLDDKELISVWESIKKAEISRRSKRKEPKNKRKSKSETLLELVDEHKDEVTPFHTELKEPYVRMQIDDHAEIWPCKSKMFKRWLGRILWEESKQAPTNDVLNGTINVIESTACFDGDQHVLHNRAAWHDGAIWYDLSDPQWRAVKITPNGWEVVSNPPILFRRYSHQQAQVHPISNGDVKALLKYVNVQSDDQKILLLVWLVSCFIPDFPHPIPNIYGAQGSAKSFLSKLLRKLIDPSATEALTFPKDVKELVQVLSHHYCAFFDNVSSLSNEISDALCKAVTGDGFSKRELFTDEDDVIFIFKRCLGINGINISARKSDLLERCILFELQRVPRNKRKQEQNLLEDFEKERSYIMGGIFDAVAKAMRIKTEIKLDSLPRMADFAVWGCAIAEALGYTQKQFLDAYYRNIRSQNTEVLADSLEASAIVRLMESHEGWEGSASELLAKLTEILTSQGVDVTKEPTFPKIPNALVRRLNMLKTNLAEEGIELDTGTKDHRRVVYLYRTEDYITSSSGDDNDDDFSNSQEKL
ncbi:hypothetical protein C4568_00265 [Candidatus Parcubacteria bacterium]|nr:MAG: hypothetical protein C4568_00265 [Candidatus Parcubacteria bacterium]